MNQDDMILRTVYLPRELDNALKNAAFHRGILKGDLIREAVQEFLKKAFNESRT